ncbi:AAA domain-containing protein [Halarchaeum nitratireducens]|uniref:ATPase AAA n=1 Tax=Halarchaeum nitratireducens TaxID=489913 RepID=A0A830GG51_9EURY|nr:AAA domain-containing protein [Halarchaeum nitratireducens]GGN25403.1 ATPase AAA [Halarchaeum nitratireducens]
MLSEIFDDWTLSDAKLLRTDVRGTEYEPVDVEAAASRAKEKLGIRIPEKNGYVVPLFATHEPTPTDEYVIYRPEKGHIGWHDSGFGIGGAERFANCEQLSENEIGHRLRFWLDEHRSEVELDIDESALPNERIHPTERLGEDARQEFFDDLTGFVDSEREAERRGNWEQYEDIGLEDAIRRDRVSGPFISLGSTSKEGETLYRYQFADDEDSEDDDVVNLRDDEGIFPGNRCILDVESDDRHFPIEVEVRSVTDPRITIRPVWERIHDRSAVEKTLTSDEAEVWVHELLNPVPYDRRVDAIDRVEQNDWKRDLLTGDRPIEYSVNKYAPPNPGLELNEYQRLALVWADSAEDVVCIHGPPGTGKTRTLTAYVRHAVSRGESVLVTAHSNQAVDNLLVGDSSLGTPEDGTLHAMAQDDDIDLSIARVGNNSRNRVVQNYYTDRSTSEADVVAATTSGTAIFDQDEFNVAVVDEATQASRPATAIVLNSAEKLVLAGDHKQLPPYCADETKKEEDMHISLFEYLLERYDRALSVLLQKQYRMNGEIAAFPNEAFYDGKLETADRNRDWSISDLKPFIGVDIDGKEKTPSYGNSYYNPDEAEAVAKQVQLLAQSGVASENIGVISAYSGQVSKIIDQVNHLDIEDTRAVSVDTVDSFQGGEKEAIIVSFVRSNDDGYSGFLEFPDEGPRRLNVALTRARKRLVLVGDWETLGTCAPHRSSEESCAELYEQLATHIRSRERMLSMRE